MKAFNIDRSLHKITIHVIGAGGTGGAILNHLARVNQTLEMLNMPGIALTVIDDDKVEPHNLGRQPFAQNDIGEYKSSTIVTRLNRFYGTDWRSEQTRIINQIDVLDCNILITCTDNLSSRKTIKEMIAYSQKNKGYNYRSEYERLQWWIDIGNEKQLGQIIFSDPEKKCPDVFDRYPKLLSLKDKKQKANCSIIESLEQQDLMINSTLAEIASHIIYKMIRHNEINHSAVFLNLENLQMTSEKIKEVDERKRK